MTTIVWREWYSQGAIEALTAMNTLPRETIDVDARFTKPHEIVEEAAQLIHAASSGEYFRHRTKITILEPAWLAGDWTIDVDYNPEFTARRQAAA